VIPDAERLDLFRRGEAFLLDALAGLSDEDLLAPCALEGWSRRHLVSHLARNADALGNLLDWARTGVETPMYVSAGEREARIDRGARRRPEVIRADALAASARLVAAVAMLPDAAWDAPVRTARNRPIDAGEVPWMRIRESWVHTVDLDVGRTFADVPTAVVDALLAEVTAGLVDQPDCPPLLLVDSGPTGRRWRIGPGAEDAGAAEVTGPAPDLLAWLIGRTDGTTLQATTPDSRPPKPPVWL
jgi:maleylpyruvate isomerase